MAAAKKKVLIVEDDLILNLLYEGYLDKLGFETEGELVYAKTAIDAARRLEPDLIIMDIVLEGQMDGIDAIKKIREFSDVPVIYITGNSDPYYRKKADNTGYLDFINKPIEYEDLKRAVEKHFNGS